MLTLINVCSFLERYQVLDCSVEIIAGKVVEEQAQLRRWLLEFKTLAMNGIDSSRDQGECAGATRAAKVRDHHASGKGCGVTTQFHDGLFDMWLHSHLLCTLYEHELLPWSKFSVPSFGYKNQQVNCLLCLNQFTNRSKLNCLFAIRGFQMRFVIPNLHVSEVQPKQ
jgi:hypothetical protein